MQFRFENKALKKLVVQQSTMSSPILCSNSSTVYVLPFAVMATSALHDSTPTPKCSNESAEEQRHLVSSVFPTATLASIVSLCVCLNINKGYSRLSWATDSCSRPKPE